MCLVIKVKFFKKTSLNQKAHKVTKSRGAYKTSIKHYCVK